MTGAFIVGWFMVVFVSDSPAMTTSQIGPFESHLACEQAKKDILNSELFGNRNTKLLCVSAQLKGE